MRGYSLLFMISTLVFMPILSVADEPVDVTCFENCVNGYPRDLTTFDEETIFVDSLYIPKGFDPNDHIEVVARVLLPTPCHRKPHGVVERISNDEIKITVKATRVVSRDSLCIDMVVPRLISIPIEQILQAGRYNIMANPDAASPLFGVMEIEPATNNSIDNFLYADVSEVSVDPATRVVTLKGDNPSPCIELERIISTSNGVNTYAVMPIMRKKDALCPQVITPFEYRYELPPGLNAPKVLVHVRTLDGNAKNVLFAPTN